MANSQKFEIYKMAVDSADQVSTRRMKANTYFLSVNSALVVLDGFALDRLPKNQSSVLLFMSAVGIVLSLAWFFSIRSYKKLNKAKYDVILDMEKTMQQKFFTVEWEKLKKTDGNAPQGVRQFWLNFKDRYTDLTNIEIVVPTLFGLAYTLVLVLVIIRYYA